MTQQAYRRFKCDRCGKVSPPLWGYPALWDWAKSHGWKVAVTRRVENEVCPSGFKETTEDFCPECAKKEGVT